VQARGSLATGSNAGALGTEKATSGNSPKEYNKENLPEASVKTFEDVKGAAEAKAELQVRSRPTLPSLMHAQESGPDQSACARSASNSVSVRRGETLWRAV
jgi:hypothetical protein